MKVRRDAKTLLSFPVFLFLVGLAIGTHAEAPRGKDEPLRSTPQESNNEGEEVCPSYGCPLLARDVTFDEAAKDALAVLRAKDAPDDEEIGEVDADVDADVILKALDTLASSGSEHAATLTLTGYKGGAVKDQINQDRAFIVSPFNVVGLNDKTEDYKLLGVFDGHGKHGEIVSEYATQQVPKLVASKLDDMSARDENEGGWSEEKRVEETKKILADTFVQVDRVGQTDLSLPSGGCTASVALKIGPMIYVANAGDSRSFIATYTKSTGAVDVVYATREDKPDLPDERERVEKMGGRIYMPEDDRDSSRVYYIDAAGQNKGGLAMSRSLGDWDLGSKGVIPDPLIDTVYIPDIVAEAEKVKAGSCQGNSEESCSALTADDVHVFAVSATDGLLDYIKPADIARTVAEGLFEDDAPHLFTACQELIYAAAKGWYDEFEYNYRDDIAIAVSKVNHNE